MKSKEGNDIYPTAKIKNEKPYPGSRAEEEASTLCRCSLMLLCFLIFSALVAARTVITMQMSRKTTTQQTEINNLIKENERMTEENEMMQNKTKELSRERDDLNKTLGFIKTFDNFPVKDYCSNKECKLCPKNWTLFDQKCYLFYEEPPPWKTWTKCREFCQNKNADLVVIDDLEEQIFVSKHIKYYWSEWNGYWIGLQQVNNTWTWIDGRVDTLGFWMKGKLRWSGPYAQLNPSGTVKENWGEILKEHERKFICERQAVIWQI